METYVLPGVNDALPDDRHGTCVASIAYGNIGIMVKGTLVAISGLAASNLQAKNIFAVFGWAINHISLNNREGKSVINFSLSKSAVVLV